MRPPPYGSSDRNSLGQQFSSGLPPPRKVQGGRAVDGLVIVLLPWLLFTLIVCIFVFAYEEFAPLVWVLLMASILLGLMFVAMGGSSGRGRHVALGLFILVSLAVAVPVGFSIESGYMREYWRIDNGAVYRNVSPSDPGSLHSDATVLEFKEGTFVDVQQSVGYMQAGTAYCVAPVMRQHTKANAQYWAVGVNCCGMRGGFACGDVEEAGALSGVTLGDDGDDLFKDAVRMAESVYELPALSKDPVLVRWTADPAGHKDGLWSSAATLSVVASAVHLAVALVGLIAVRCML